MGERANRGRNSDAARRRVAKHDAVRRNGGIADLDDLRALTDDEDPAVAGDAAVVLLLTAARLGRDVFEAEVPRIVGLVRTDDLPHVAADLLSGLVWIRCLYIIDEYSRTGNQPDPGLLAETAELAELGHARDARSVDARKALAFVRCAQGRNREARELLVNVSLEQLVPEPDVQADVLAVRALAELQLGDVPQARRLINLAHSYHRSTGLLTTLEQMTQTAERQSSGTTEAEATDAQAGTDPTAAAAHTSKSSTKADVETAGAAHTAEAATEADVEAAEA